MASRARVRGFNTLFGGGSSLITPSVAVSRTSGKAPLGVLFDASATTGSTSSNPEHEYFYAWNFGDDKTTYWSRGPAVNQNKNVEYGPQVGHVFLTSGTFSWSVLILDGSGNVNSTGGSITVSDWTEAETIYIANGSTPTAGANGVGSGALGYYNETTWAGVASRAVAGKRVRLNNSSTWSVVSQEAWPTGVQVDGYGTGSAWNLTSTADNQDPFYINNTKDDIRIIGGKHTGPGGIQTTTTVTVVDTCSNLLMLNMESTATRAGFSSTPTALSNLFLVDNNIHDIGLSAVSPNVGSIGIYMEECYGLFMSGNLVDNIHTNHCVRVAGCQKALIANNTISRPRWDYPNPGDGGHCLTVRGFTNDASLPTWNGIWTEKTVIRNNLIDGSAGSIDTLHIASQNSGDASRHRNIIVECNYIKSYKSQGLTTEVSSNMTARNNIFTDIAAPYSIVVQAISSVGAPAPSQTRLYNNTFWKTAASSPSAYSAVFIRNVTSSPTGTEITNNLVYAPDDTADGFQTGTQATLLMQDVGGTGYTTSNNSSNTQIKNTKPWAATTPVNPVDFTPDSYGINGGTSVPVVKDFFNQTITGTREIGAIQV